MSHRRSCMVSKDLEMCISHMIPSKHCFCVPQKKRKILERHKREWVTEFLFFDEVILQYSHHKFNSLVNLISDYFHMFMGQHPYWKNIPDSQSSFRVTLGLVLTLGPCTAFLLYKLLVYFGLKGIVYGRGSFGVRIALIGFFYRTNKICWP